MRFIDREGFRELLYAAAIARLPAHWAVALGRTRRLVFLGVEVDDVTVGRPPSDAAARALPTLSEEIEVEVAAILEEEPS